MDKTTESSEANLFLRNVAGIIDAAIVILIFLTVINFLPDRIITMIQSPIRPELYVLMFFVLYRFVSLVYFNETIGMKLIRIKLLSHDFKPLSFKEKVFATFFILFRGVDYYKK